MTYWLISLIRIVKWVFSNVSTLQVVPTVFTDIGGHTIQSNQVLLRLNCFIFKYLVCICCLNFVFWRTTLNSWSFHLSQFSVTEHVRGAELSRLQALPGVFFFYDLSPIKVSISFPSTVVQEEDWLLYVLNSTIIFNLLFRFLCGQVTFTETHVSFLHFLTNVCAIVGGLSLSLF